MDRQNEMQSELKTTVSREFYFCVAALLAIALILAITKWTPFGLFVAISLLAIFAYRLVRGGILMVQLARGPILVEEKNILVVPGGSFCVPLPKQDMSVWLSISGPVGRLKGKVKCITDKGIELECFNIEDHGRTSRSGSGFIFRSFQLNNQVQP